MMKKIILFSFIMLLIIGCTKLGEPTMHPGEWTDQYAENSHIEKITVTGTDACKACHGNDGKGGVSEVSCFQCHAGGPSGHPAISIWVGSPDSPDFHGKDGIDRCQTCHGEEYLGGISEVSCSQCHAGGPSGHPAFGIWVGSPDSLDFHGKDDIARCITCHGEEYLGGTSDVSCFQCHAGGPSGHPAISIWVDTPGSPDFHGKDDIARCITCHGEDYLGGTSGVSCYQCHDGPNAFSCPEYSPPSTHTVLQEEEDCEALHMPGFEDPMNNGCTICHGIDLTEGFAPSCFTCHGNRWEDD